MSILIFLRSHKIDAVYQENRGLLGSTLRGEERISHLLVEGVWKTTNQIVYDILYSKINYYTDVTGSSKAFLEVVQPVGRGPYVRTIPDKNKRNNLLYLPGGPFCGYPESLI